MTIYDGVHSIQFIPVSILTNSKWGYRTYDNMKSGSNFLGKNTWDDWRLIPAERPSVAMPPLRSEYVTLPSMDGSYDATEIVASQPVYEDRTGSWEFIVDNDYDGYSWIDVYTEIASYLHGKRVRVVLTDDPDYYYEGRVSVSWTSDASFSRIQFDYVLEPYKRDVVVKYVTLANTDAGGTKHDLSEYGIVPTLYRAKPEFDIIGTASNGVQFTLFDGDGSTSASTFKLEGSQKNKHVVPPSFFRIHDGVVAIRWKLSYSSSLSVKMMYRGGKL